MVRKHPFLSANTRITQRELVFIPTGSRLIALAGDAGSNAGANMASVSFTECWGISYEMDKRNYEELTPPPGLFSGLPALRIADSYAGHLEESDTWHNLVDLGLEGTRLPGDWPIYLKDGVMLFHIQGVEGQRRCYRGTPQQAEIYYRDQTSHSPRE